MTALARCPVLQNRGVKLASVLDLVVPTTCVFCHRLGAQLCSACEPEWMHEASAPLECSVGDLNGFALTAFDGSSAAVLTAVKDHGRTSLLNPIAESMARVVRSRYAGRAPLGLLGVPSSRASVRRRGLNLGQMLVGKIAKYSGTSVCGGLSLLRPTADQRDLTAEERFANLNQSMQFEPKRTLQPESGGPPPLVIIDDVLTTGATIQEVHRAVRVAGFEPIGFVTFAHTKKEFG